MLKPGDELYLTAKDCSQVFYGVIMFVDEKDLKYGIRLRTKPLSEHGSFLADVTVDFDVTRYELYDMALSQTMYKRKTE